MKPMDYQKKDYSEKRIIDFNPQICGLKDDGIIVFSPLSLMEGNNLFLPEGIRMPNGEISNKVIIDHWSYNIVLSSLKNGPITLYAGRNYAYNYYSWVMGLTKDSEKDYALYFSNVNCIYLYDDFYEFNEIGDKTIKISSENGILYCDDKVAFVPDCNPYAETLPLEPMHGLYKEDFCDLENFSLEGYGRDPFGGIYSLDGKRFLRYDGMTNRRSYRIREGVEDIYDKAFWVVTGLGNGDHGLSFHSIELPQSLKRIGKEAFRACSLQNINLPDSVEEIGDSAFLNCQILETIILPPNLRRIGCFAFKTAGIKSITIPASVESIGDMCFDNCYQLSSIEVEKGNKYYISEDGILYNMDKTCIIRIPPLLPPDSPDNVNERKDIELCHIEEYRSEEDGIVHYKDLYEGVSYVNKTDETTGEKYKVIIRRDDVHLFPSINLFKCCLSEGNRLFVEDGEHVKAGTLLVSYTEHEYKPDWEAYYGPSRREYKIPDNVIIISDGALQRCPFKKLALPRTIKSIGGHQEFAYNTDFFISPENENYETRENVIIEKKSKKLLHWFGKEKDIVIPQGVEIIGERAYDYIEFRSLVIPEGVKCIENNAFWCSSRGFTIYLPSSLCYIAPHAFRNLNGMREYDCEYNIFVPHRLTSKYVKLLDNYNGCHRDIKEINSGSIEKDPSENNYKALAAWNDDVQKQAVADDYYVYYSKDGKLLTGQDGFDIPSYHVKEGTEIICENAALSATTIHLPSSVKYVGEWGIFTQSLVLEGANILFAPNWWGLDKDNYFYIPCGSWAKYREILEKTETHDESDEEKSDVEKEYDDYKLIELSRASVLAYLRSQLSVFKNVIEQQKVLQSYDAHSLNGTNESDIYCFRTQDQVLVFTCNLRCFLRYAAYLSILGYSLKDVTDFLEFQIETIEVRDDTIESAVYKTIALPVKKEWIEDFVDEETGEVEKEEFSEIVFPVGHWIYGDDIKVLKESGVKNISVIDQSHSDYASIAYFFTEPGTDDWQFLYPELYEQDRNAALNAVLMEMFPFKRPEEITDDDKSILAHNILTVIKGITEHSSNVLDYILPFKYSGGDIHKEMSDEEQNVYRLINEFYNEMIEKITACNTDSEVMKVFKDKSEILFELQSYLKDNGVSSQIIRAFVDNIFLYLK